MTLCGKSPDPLDDSDWWYVALSSVSGSLKVLFCFLGFGGGIGGRLCNKYVNISISISINMSFVFVGNTKRVKTIR